MKKAFLIQKFKSIARAGNLIIDKKTIFAKKPLFRAQKDPKWTLGDPKTHKNLHETKVLSKMSPSF